MNAKRGVTLAELLIGLAITAVVMSVVYGMMSVFFNTSSRFSVTNMTRRSFVQKDAKSGLRRLIYRLREGIQVLEPEPGRGATELVFRDLTNTRIKVRRDATANRMISERFEGGAWVLETQPVMFSEGSTQLPAAWPVYMPSCTDLYFTVLAPDCVAVEASLISDGQPGSLATVVKLRNVGLAK